MKQLTGCSCPGCGMTHAAIFSLQGRWADACNANPAIIAFWGGYVATLCAAAIQLFSRLAPLGKTARLANIMSLGAMLIVWVTRIT
jgi:hypothetical protein